MEVGGDGWLDYLSLRLTEPSSIARALAWFSWAIKQCSGILYEDWIDGNVIIKENP